MPSSVTGLARSRGPAVEPPRRRGRSGLRASGGPLSSAVPPRPSPEPAPRDVAPQAHARPAFDAPRRGLCLVISAPSGAGKSTITRHLLDAEPALSLSVSATTRAPRPGEVDGTHYHFRDPDAFSAMAEAGELLEWAEVFGRRYGTPRAPVAAALDSGRDVVFDIDWQGWRQLREAIPEDTVGVFVLPPSLDALQSRLSGRGSDAPAEIERRMAAARSEIAHWREFDHVVVNAELHHAVAEIRAILHAARSATARQPGLAQFVARLSG